MISRHGVPSITDAQVNYASRAANLFLAGPTSGGATTPGWRSISLSDIPSVIAALLSIPSTNDSDAPIVELTQPPTTNHRILSGQGPSSAWKANFNITSTGSFEIVYNATNSSGTWTRTDLSSNAYRYEFTTSGTITIQTKTSGTTWTTWDTTATLDSVGRITADGAVRCFGGWMGHQTTTVGVSVGYGITFPKKFVNTPSSFTAYNQSYTGVNPGFFPHNATTNGVGIYHSINSTGTVWIFEEIEVV